MACSLVISTVSGTKVGGVLTSIEVTGSVAGCTKIAVTIRCGSTSFTLPANISGSNWSVDFDSAHIGACQCDQNISVSAVCNDGISSCSATAPTPLLLNCTPCCDVVVSESVGSSCDNGQRFVTFHIVNNCASIVNAQLFFGDGTSTSSLPLVPGTNSPQGHLYSPGSHIATLKINGCPDLQIPFTVDPCPPCCDVQMSSTVSANCNNGKRAVTLQILNNCPATINAQCDFGDGSSGSVSLAAGNNSVTHIYAPGSYTAVLHIPGCPDVSKTFTVPPCCCPQITTSVEVGQCDDFGKTNVCLTGIVDVPAGCNVTVQWDFGDGQKDGNHSFSSGSNTFTECHDYAPGSYQAHLNVVSPSGCKSSSIKVNVPPCDCCPSVSVIPCVEDCDKHGNRLVTFIVSVSAKPAPCPSIQVQMDFGDGSMGGTHSLPPGGSVSYTETNTYTGSAALQDNTAALNVIQPQGCPGWSQVIPKCCRPKRMTTCKLLLFAASLLLALSLFFLLISFCSLCTIITGWCFNLSPTLLRKISLGLALSALIPLIFFLVLCTKCICGWIWLLLWRVLFFVGVLYAVFARCCMGIWSVLIGIALMLIGFAFLLCWRKKCCVRCCAFLGEIVWWMGTVVIVAFGFFNSVWNYCLYILFTFTFGSFTITITFWKVLLAVWGVFGTYFSLTCPCSERHCKDC